MASSSAAFPSRPFNLRVDSWINWQSGRRASVHVNLWIDKTAYSPTYNNNAVNSIEVWLGGVRIATWGPSGFDFRNGNNFHMVSVDAETNLDNAGGVWVAGYASFNPLGYTETGHGLYGTAATVPPAPTQHQPTNVTINSMRVTFSGNGDGGSPMYGWELWRATDAAFTQNVVSVVSTGTTDVTGLNPGTTYYFKSRGNNAIGLGPYSNVVSQATLPATPPGLIVASSPSGTSATLTFTAPGGAAGVTKYSWERRVKGTVTPVTAGESVTAIVTIPDLVPGTIYEWRASAWFGTYQSPWSTPWTELAQAKPNVNPGDYFDGATPDVADLDYAWTGAANGSTSTATAVGVEGWAAIFVNGAGVLYRVTAGIFSAFAARVQVTMDATTWGQIFGQQRAAPYWTEVTPGAMYVGSIYARPSRSQNMAAHIEWMNAAGASIVGSAALGAGTVVAGGTWARLSVSGVAPAGAAWAAVSAFDQQGTGHSTWKGGDVIDLDGAMISLNEQFPYFDGSTLTDGTYAYEWTGVANKSTSTRTPLEAVTASGQMLVGGLSAEGPGIGLLGILDPNCIPPAPPRPPVIENACITEAGVWRRRLQVIPSTQISDYLDVVPTFELVTVSSTVSQVRIRIYPNPESLPVELFDTTSGWISEQIISYVPAATVMTIDGVHQRVYAEVAGSDPIAADHLLYGSNGTPASWPVLSCGLDYVVSADLPIDVPQLDSSLEIYLTTRY